jgi:hypothetical protein
MQEAIEGRALAIREEVKAPAIGESKPLRYSLPELRQVGEIMFASGMFRDLKSVQQAMVKLLAGAELGYGPFQSLRAFHVIEGKPVETSGEITARIKRSGKYRMETYFIDESGNHLDPIKTKSSITHGCVVLIHERVDGTWIPLEPVVFTKDDAKEAGLLSKQVWKSYLRDMLFARTLTAAARRHCADIFGGPIYGPEEFGAEVSIDSEGNQVIVGFEPPAPPPQTVEPKKEYPTEEGRRKLLIRDIHILCQTRGISRPLYLSTLDELYPEKPWPPNKNGEMEPTSKMLDVDELQNVYATLSERPATEAGLRPESES